MKRTLAFYTVATMLLLAGTAFAQNGAETTRLERCGAIVNPCCGDLVEFCLDVNLVRKGKEMFHSTMHGTATTLDGTNYVVLASDGFRFDPPGDGAQSISMHRSLKMIATGNPECTFTLHAIMHVTWNANGEITAEIDKYWAECGNGVDIE